MGEKKKFIERLAEKRFFRFFLNNKNALWLIVKCLLLIAFAYGYPFLCGLIFQTLLHVEHLLAVLLFMAVTILLIYLFVIFMITLAIIWFIKKKKESKSYE